MTSLGMKPATFRFVAQFLNQLRYRVPYKTCKRVKQFVSASRFTYIPCCNDSSTTVKLQSKEAYNRPHIFDEWPHNGDSVSGDVLAILIKGWAQMT
jgi:hypothetical protein